MTRPVPALHYPAPPRVAQPTEHPTDASVRRLLQALGWAPAPRVRS